MKSVQGTNGADTIVGTAGDDEIHGLGGDDKLSGGIGGFDTLDGGDGDDHLTAGPDGGVMIGGAGTDTVRFADGIRAVASIQDDPSRFFSFLTGTNATVQLVDVEVIELNDDRDFDLALQLGTSNAERIVAAGDLRLWAFGGAGDDTLIGSASDAPRFGDQLDAGSGNDVVTGSAREDRISGGPGDDTLTGGGGRDAFVLQAGEGGTDLIEDFGYADTVEVLELRLSAADIATAFDGTFTTVTYDADADGAPDGRFRLRGDFDGAIIAVTYDGGEVDRTYLRSTIGVRIEAAPSGDPVVGGAGDDTITGSDADDFLEGDLGDDLIEAAIGADLVYGGEGDDTLRGGTGDDWLSGEDGDDSLEGGDGDDRLVGHGGSNLLFGGAGMDTLIVAASPRPSERLQAGHDRLRGGADDDRLEIVVDGDQAGAADAAEVTGQGATLSGLLSDETGAVRTFEAETVEGLYVSMRTSGSVTLSGDFSMLTMPVNGFAPIFVQGYVGDDLIDASGVTGVGGTSGRGRLRLAGGEGADTIFGGAVAEELIGGEGDDWLVSGGGSDFISGGEGRDVLDLSHETGGLVVALRAGRTSTVSGRAEAFEDVVDIEGLVGGLGNDEIGVSGDLGMGSYLDGGAGADTLFGGAYGDEVYGGDGADVLYGDGLG